MTARGVAKDFGRYLQSSRRARSISLGVVSHQTKITLENLRQIENEQLGQLPSPVFVKGFVKSFALAVGADPIEAALRLENYLAANDRDTSVSVTWTATYFSWYHLVLAAFLFAIQIGATLYMAGWMHAPSTEPPQTAAASKEITETAHAAATHSPLQENIQPTPTTEAPRPAALAPETENALPQPVVIPTPVTPSIDTLELSVSAVEATWLKVVSDDKMPREFLLQTDQHITLMAKRQFDLTIGNAGGIRLMLNDRPVQVVGARGQVVGLRLP